MVLDDPDPGPLCCESTANMINQKYSNISCCHQSCGGLIVIECHLSHQPPNDPTAHVFDPMDESDNFVYVKYMLKNTLICSQRVVNGCALYLVYLVSRMIGVSMSLVSTHANSNLSFAMNTFPFLRICSAGHLPLLPDQVQTSEVQQRVHVPRLGLRHRLVHGHVLHGLHPAGDYLDDLEDPRNLQRGKGCHHRRAVYGERSLGLMALEPYLHGTNI